VVLLKPTRDKVREKKDGIGSCLTRVRIERDPKGKILPKDSTQRRKWGGFSNQLGKAEEGEVRLSLTSSASPKGGTENKSR